MSQRELLIAMIGALEAAGVDSMLTGSLAASLQGEPRATHGIDIVVALSAGSAAECTSRFWAG